MILPFHLQIILPLVVGPAILWLGRFKPWGAVLFLAAQLAFAYGSGYGGLTGLGVVLVLLAAYIFGATRERASAISRRGMICGLGGYLLYWFVEKYALPLGLLQYVVIDLHHWPARAEGLTRFVAIAGSSYIGFKLIHFAVDHAAGLIKNPRPVEFLSWLFFSLRSSRGRCSGSRTGRRSARPFVRSRCPMQPRAGSGCWRVFF